MSGSACSPGYPWLHIAGIACYSFLLYEMGPLALVSTGVFVVACLVWYHAYFRGRGARTSALLHVVERVADKKIAGDSLREELREILRERDELVEDRFDRLVTGCVIMDLPGEMGHEAFFRAVAEKVAVKMDMDEGELSEALITRERESTTEVRPGLAIPHVTLDGTGRFELVVARCEGGIHFSDELPPVYAAFILMGSRDARDFHLRALSAVAQITQDVNFDRDWLKARSIDDLRDIVLLGKRRRV